MAVVKYRSTSKLTCLVSIVSIILYIIRQQKQNKMIGIAGTLKHKQRREKQQVKC